MRFASVLLLVVGCQDGAVFEFADGSVRADSGSDAACGVVAPQCTDGPARVCFENAAACSGDVVEVAVVVLGDGCPGSGDQGGGFELGPFELVNPQSVDSTVGRCLRREIVGDSVEWSQLSSATLPMGCPDSYPRGEVDRILLRVPEDLAPGEYPLTGLWGLVQGEGACGTMDPALGPTITVF